MSKALERSYKAFAVIVTLGVIAFIAFATPWFGPRLILSARHFWDEICGDFLRLCSYLRPPKPYA